MSCMYKKRQKNIFITGAKICFLAIIVFHFAFSSALAQVVKSYTWDEQYLIQSRQKALTGDKYSSTLINKIKAAADILITEPNVNVRQKKEGWQKYFPADHPVTANEYVSFSTYYYPDTAIGKTWQDPWIKIEKRGGNTEIRNKFGYTTLGSMQKRVINCAKAYWFTNDVKYAKVAASQLREWFIDPATRMLPEMDHAQFVPFDPIYKLGSAYGIIDLMDFHNLFNSIELIKSSGEWTNDDEAAIKEWMYDFTQWLLTSPLGKIEGKKENNNNHGIYYDVLLLTQWLYLGENYKGINWVEKAKDYLLHFSLDARVLYQIGNGQLINGEPIYGGMYRELHRPGASAYESMCLNGFNYLAVLAKKIGIDLYDWNYQDSDKRNLRGALEWTLPYIDGTKNWLFGDYQKNHFSAANVLNAFWVSSTYIPTHFKLFNNYILTQNDNRSIDNNEYNLLFPRPVIYYDDFASSINPVKNRSFIRGGTFVNNKGELQLQNPSKALDNLTPGNLCFHDAEVYGDFQINVKLRLDSENKDAAIGMAFMANCNATTENYYYVLLSKDKKGSGIFKVKGDGTVSGTKRIKIANIDEAIIKGTIYDLRIKHQSNNTIVLVNEQKVGEMFDSEFSSGRIGFVSQNSACSFLHIRITNAIQNMLPFVTHVSAFQDEIKVSIGASYSIIADAVDFDGGISKVEFYDGNRKLGESLSEPYSFLLKNISKGKHTISIKAIDNNQGVTTNQFTILSDN